MCFTNTCYFDIDFFLDLDVYESNTTSEDFFFLGLIVFESIESNTTFEWLNHVVKPIRIHVAFKFTKLWQKRHRVFLKMVGEY